MLRMLFAICLSALSDPVLGQETPNIGRGERGVADLITVQATSPRIINQQDDFRVMFRISTDLDIIYVAAPFDNARGFSASGSRCRTRYVDGISRLGQSPPTFFKQPNELTEVTPKKPAMMVIDFSCDGPLVAGEEVTFNIYVTVQVDARRRGDARYVFERAVLKK